MDERSTLLRSRPLRLRLTDDVFTKLADIATSEDRTVERQAERLLREAIVAAYAEQRAREEAG